MCGAPSIDQQHPLPCSPEPLCRPCAKHTGTDNHTIPAIRQNHAGAFRTIHSKRRGGAGDQRTTSQPWHGAGALSGLYRRCIHAHRLEIFAHIASGLAQPLFILDHRDADIAFAFLSIANARCNRDTGMG